MTAGRTPRLASALLLAGLTATALAGCGGGDSGSEAASSAPSSSPASSASLSSSEATEAAVSGEVLVSAAASLTDAFTEIGDRFEGDNPDATVTFSFGPSSGLATQITEGAPADVAAFASTSTMQTLVDAAAVKGDPEPFASNRLVIVTKPGNPTGITGLADISNGGVVALCGEKVPCGAAAQKALEAAGVTIPETSVTRGEDVRATLSAVTQGDAVAGIVYVTDALVAGDTVATVEIPDDQNAPADYPIALLTASAQPEAAQAFVDYVLGPQGQEVLASYGFLPAS